MGYSGSMGGTGISPLTGLGGLAAIPVAVNGETEDKKLYTDRYEVFVNGDKVGEKVNRTQVEDAQYLESYLTNNGFEGFDYQVVGGHIEINTKEHSGLMKEILSSYLSIN